jgi:hypothetical protein
MKGHILRRIAALSVSVVSVSALVAAAGTGSASAAAQPLQILPTYTSVTFAPNTVQDGATVNITLTATVAFNLIVTPTGTVSFYAAPTPGASADPAAGGGLAATVPLQCAFLTLTCTATFVVPPFVEGALPGVYQLEAIYAGDVLSKPSAGTTTATVVAAH